MVFYKRPAACNPTSHVHLKRSAHGCPVILPTAKVNKKPPRDSGRTSVWHAHTDGQNACSFPK